MWMPTSFFLPIWNDVVEQSAYWDSQCPVPRIIQDSDHGLVPINMDVFNQFQMHRTSHPLSRACKQLLCKYAPEEASTLLLDVDVDVEINVSIV